MSPLIPLLILLLGAGALLVGLLPRFQSTGLIAVTTVALALLSLLMMAFRLPTHAILSQWSPASLFAVGLTLEVDRLAWMFAAGVLVATLATLLTGVTRPGGRRLLVRAAMLLMTFTGLAALFANNLITRIVAWASLDLIYFLALLLLAEDEGLEPQAVLNLAFNSAGTLLALGAALMISRTSDTLSLRDAALTAQSTLLISLAAVFRLGLFPLHLGLPAEANIRQGLGTLLRLIPAAVALELIARLAEFGFAAPLQPWLTVFGVAAVWVGAVQLWNVEDPRLGLTHIVIAQSGLALLAGLWSGAQAAAAVTAQSLALVLGSALIFLSSGHDEQRPRVSLLPGLGALAMLGAPLTLGFMGANGLYGGLENAGNWLVLILVALAQIVFAAGLLRAIFWPGSFTETVPAMRAAYFGGLALPAAFLILGGLSAGAFQAALGAPTVGPFGDVLGWAGTLVILLVAMGGGFALWRFEPRIKARAELAGVALNSLIHLGWLYRFVWGVIHLLGALVFNLAEVLEGEGAFLWTLVAVFLVWLLLR
jgi:formate hydrogenlyase subunit 3/multisubunit Na+/H+ antiporter MnhD subunit